MPRSAVLNIFIGLLIIQLPIILWSAFIFSGMLNYTFVGLGSFPGSKFIAIVAAIFDFPHLIGLYLHACYIRIWASLKYWNFGIASFSHNYQEAVLVIDMRHSPALLPQAGKVNSRFVLDGLLNLKSETLFDRTYKSLLAITLYIPALVYRWNIKASALIWAPVALGLSPTKWRNYTELREQSSLSTDKWLFATSVAFLAALVAILAIPYLPIDFVEVLPKWMESKTVISFRPLPNTIRYGLLCLFSLTFAFQLFLALRMRTQHDKPLSSAADFAPYFEKVDLKDDLKSFTKQADYLRRILKINTAVAIFIVWAFALKFALDKWPNELQKVVWNWLKPLI